ncbi:hypothetical protein ACIBH1_47235 [Nonomuraea sp. NPDC050663]|uniref:hypothetical protein n=1 Tax=Nonomuraea sp. NPDC050663 TaxID=3364370 RepID=UPI00379B4FBC
MHPDVLKVLSIKEPLERAKEAGRVHDEFQKGGEELARVRREALLELVDGGMNNTQIGEALGMTRQRVGQLLKSGPAPERAFLGTDMLTVVMVGKLETGRPDPQPVVPHDDLIAFERIRQLAKVLGLDATSEVEASGGFVRLNRDNLFVMCGPRHFPNLREVIESDESISFDKDDQGWHLIDHRAGRVFRSPMDAGEPRDYAYLARLRRPDGKGTFLYGAGIHAVGEAGIAHFLEHNIADMYKQLKGKRFSAIIECDFDPGTTGREIVATRLASDYYLVPGA